MESISIIKHNITNHSGFEDSHIIELEPDKPTVIFGVNGAGKTSLLNSLYGSVMVSVSNVIGVNFQSINLSKSSVTINKTESNFLTNFLIKESDLNKMYEVGYKIFISGQTRFQGKGYSAINTFLKNRYNNDTELIPLFRFFRSEKRSENALITSKNYNTIEQRNKGYKKHFDLNLSISETTSFIIDQVNIENQAKVDKNDLKHTTKIGQYIRETLDLFTTVLYGEKVGVSVRGSKYSNGQSIQIKKKNDVLEFVQLSSGEKYVIGMVLELIYRNTILNSNVENLRNTPGIVLIDEIESHLHPRWQLTILKALQACFPKVQFIASSHSPLVAASVRNEQIIALSNFDVIPKEALKNIYSGTANETLREILFSDFEISDFNAERDEINKLIKQFKYEEADIKLEILKKKVNANPKWIRDFERKISFAKA